VLASLKNLSKQSGSDLGGERLGSFRKTSPPVLTASAWVTCEGAYLVPPLSSMISMPALWHLGPSDSFREPHTNTAAVLRYELDCGLRSEIPWFQDLDAPALQGGSKRRFDRAGENWFRFAKSAPRFLSLWRIWNAHTRSTTVPVDALDAGGLEGAAEDLRR
jgi:hypothetical protein